MSSIDPNDTGRTCAFCGYRGALSREHVWPKWLEKVIPRYGPRSETYLELPGVPRQHRGGGQTFTNVMVKRVCQSCNGGWMSRLEQQAKSVLSEPIRGKSRQLDPADQVIAATWATKMVLVLALHVPDAEMPIPTSDYRWFMDNREPMPSWQVHVGAYGGKSYPWLFRLAAFRQSVDGEDAARPQTHLTTLSVGHLVMQVFGTTLKQAVLAQPSGELSKIVRRIWTPEDSFSWPPGPALDDPDLLAVSGAGIESDAPLQ